MKNRRKLSIFALICIVAACIGLASCSDSNSVVAYDIPEKLWGDYEGLATLKISRHEIILENRPLEEYFALEYGRISGFSQNSPSDTSYQCSMKVTYEGQTYSIEIRASLSGNMLSFTIESNDPEFVRMDEDFTKIS